MRTVSGTSSARLYYLDEGDGGARTLFYGPLAKAMTVAAQQPDNVQAGLFLQTEKRRGDVPRSGGGVGSSSRPPVLTCATQE